MKIQLFNLLFVMAFAVFGPAAASAQDNSDKTIAEIAMETEDLSTLVAAVKAAGLAETLMGDGPMTVFAPTNEAFSELPTAVVNALMEPGNKQLLTNILTYHVAQEKVMAGDLDAAIRGSNEKKMTGTTINGDFTASLFNDGVVLEDAKGRNANVVMADIMARNGVVHVIDRVLLPENVDLDKLMMKAKGMAMTEKQRGQTTSTSYPASNRSSNMADNTVVDVAMGNDDFSTLVTAIQAAELAKLLKTNTEFTVFAPTNAAFDKLPEGTVADLTKSENKEKLQNILKYHVIAGKVTAGDLVKQLEDRRGKGYFRIQTISGESLYAYMDGDKVMLTGGASGTDVEVVQTDVMASNGVIHAIDGVLMPKDRSEMGMMDN
jgi:uncharacterized surface protein with fasciclin (FAS1) repeats